MKSEVQAQTTPQTTPQTMGRLFPKYWRIRTKLLVSFAIVLAVPIMGIIVGIFTTRQAASTLRDNAIAEELASTQSQAVNVERFLAQDRADVFTLNELSSLQNLLAALPTGDDAAIAQTKTATATDFLAFANHEPSFYQVRYIDAAGQEIVRVDSKGGQTFIVPDAELQNKADRGYFQESIQLAEGDLYISRLDLNVEQGAIEEPFVPVIRYATPVFFDGEPAGIVITNIYAQEILDLVIPDAGDQHLLVDEDGFYLQHEDAAYEWGRDLGTG
ncbi:MAG: cache domain-containing protein, partial [Anaerolineae bacterium]|nr:cache domain-containing protein [Anaerolineae bacterium]